MWIQNKWDITDALGDKNNFFLYRSLKRCDGVISEKKIDVDFCLGFKCFDKTSLNEQLAIKQFQK